VSAPLQLTASRLEPFQKAGVDVISHDVAFVEANVSATSPPVAGRLFGLIESDAVATGVAGAWGFDGRGDRFPATVTATCLSTLPPGP
jgi:hypothetical protein